MPTDDRAAATPDIFYVMAATQEYGPCLRARITPLITGVGPVEAAIRVTEALTRRAVAGQLPRYVVSLGSAGSARLPQAGLFQASEVSYRDMDASPLGFERGVTPFLDQPAVHRLAHFVPGLPRATLSTGADIVSGASYYAAIAADMVDMETYAVLRACQIFDVPLIALRGISDGDSELATLSDWTQYLHVIDEKLADAVDRLEDAVRRGTLE